MIKTIKAINILLIVFGFVLAPLFGAYIVYVFPEYWQFFVLWCLVLFIQLMPIIIINYNLSKLSSKTKSYTTIFCIVFTVLINVVMLNGVHHISLLLFQLIYTIFLMFYLVYIPRLKC